MNARFASSFICLLGLAANGEDFTSKVPLTNAITQQVFNIVRIQPSGEGADHDAAVGEPVHGEDLMHTGPLGSLAAIEFNNGTIARFGSQTVFTFSTKSNLVSLTRGLALICVKEENEVFCKTCALHIIKHSTGVIESFTTGGTNGTPERCATKFILLEGNAVVSKPNGKETKKMRGGQMIVQFADDPNLADVREVDIKQLVKESRIITGFKTPLPSIAKIQQVIDRQQQQLGLGTLEPTRFIIGGRGTDRYVIPSPGKPDFEAPFDPDVPAGIVKDFLTPCPTCQ